VQDDKKIVLPSIWKK